MSYREMDPSDPNTIVNRYILPSQIKTHFKKYRATITVYPPVPGPTESSACLLLALKTLQAEGVAVDDQLRYAVADTDGDTMPNWWTVGRSRSRFSALPPVGSTRPTIRVYKLPTQA